MSYAHIPQKPGVVIPYANPTGNCPQLNDYYVSIWIPEHRHLSHTTLGQYEKYMRKYISPLLGDRTLDTITHTDVQMLIDTCPTYKTAKDAKDTLSSILGYAVRATKILLFNPALGPFYYPPKTDGREEQGYVLQSFSEITDYLHELKINGFPMDIRKAATVGLLFGLRPGEDFGLDSNDFSFAHHTLKIHQSYSHGSHGCKLNPKTKTDAGMRTLDIYPYAIDALLDLPIGTPGEPWIQNKYHRRCDPQTVSDKLSEWREKYDLPNVTFETMRHSFATAALRAGISDVKLAAWLGHADPAYTKEHYCRIDPNRVQELGDELDSAVRGEAAEPSAQNLSDELIALIAKIAKS